MMPDPVVDLNEDREACLNLFAAVIERAKKDARLQGVTENYGSKYRRELAQEAREFLRYMGVKHDSME